MSPEQLTGQVDVDARTDVFALGVVLFQCLAGTLPFDGPTIEALMVRILGGRPASFESLGEGVPPALVDVVRAALELDRDVRIASASDLVRALEPFRPVTLGGARGARDAWALASTVGSNPPARPASSPPDARPKPRPAVRRAMAFVAVAAVALAAGGALFAARSVRMASIAPGAATAGSVAPSAATARAEVLSDRLIAPFEVASSAAVRDRPPTIAGPAGTRRALAAAAPAATSATAASVAPSAARPTAAQNLGLREDNPFR
jgi:serine/threonine-protein kinase